MCVCKYAMYIGRLCNNHWLCYSNNSGIHKQIKV